MREFSQRDISPEAARLPGVIDTFGFGFAAVVSRPWVVAPLLMLEFLLLFAPRLTLESDARELANRARERGAGWQDVAAEAERLEDYNIAEMLAIGAPLVRMPVLMPVAGGPNADLPGWKEFRLDVPPPLSYVVTVLIVISGFAAAALYRLLAATTIHDGGTSRPLGPGIILRTGFRLFGLIASMFGLLSLVTLPVLLASVGLTLIGYTGIGLLWVLVLLPTVWGLLHFYFAVHAVTLDRTSPMTALKLSYRVVNRYFWQAVRFIAVTLLISTGFGVLLQGMGDSPALVLPAVILNAFLATGMIVAAMLFYRDRARQLGQPLDVSGR